MAKDVKFQSSLEKYPDHVKAIGMISIENGNMEDVMMELFARMLFINIRVANAIYFTPRAALARIEIFENAAKAALSPKTREEHPDVRATRIAARDKVLRIVRRAKKLTFKRHSIIHDQWGVDEEEVHRYVAGSPILERVPVPLAELEAIVRDFRQLISDMLELAEQFRQHPPTLVKMGSS